MTLRSRLLAALTYVLLLAIVALGVPLAINLRARVNAEVKTQAQAQADLVAATAADLLAPTDRRELTTLARTAAASVRGRVLVVNRAGAVLVDSAGPSQVGSSYESRPEIQTALAGRPVQVQRSSRTLGQPILATAVPIIRSGRPVGAVRITQSVAAVGRAVRRAVFGLAVLGFVVLGLGLLAGAVIAGQVGRPIRRLEAVARRVARGDLSARAGLEGSREQRSLARSFNDMTAQVARLLAAQRDFVADASHQLRTPLTGLRLRLEEARATSHGAAADELAAAIAEVDRLSHTVDELLILSSAGDRRLTETSVELGRVAESAVARWRPQAEEHEITLECRRAADLSTAWASLPDVERALDALLENAIRYSPPGTAVTVASGTGTIEVRDRGPGIAEHEREMIFERSRRGHAGRVGPPGSGLGLTIARELARGWNGEVTIVPRPDGGAIASLRLPARGPAREDRDQPTLPALSAPEPKLR